MLFSSKKLELCPNDIPIWKRTFDILFILAVLPFLLPLLAIIALGIRILSPGPVLFRQERIGYRGRPFCILKFRSMQVDADSEVHQKHLERLLQVEVPMKKLDLEGDSRLIPFGSFLRATGLDEVPQLLNVLRGEMSIVGPRPCIAYEYECYLPGQKRRFDTVPGLTGLWQVSGKNKTTFTEMVSMDISYAHNKSFWLDLRIILKTGSPVIEQVKELATKRLSGIRRASNLPSTEAVADASEALSNFDLNNKNQQTTKKTDKEKRCQNQYVLD